MDASRILLADDRPEIVQLLRIQLDLEPDLVVVGEARNGAEAVGLARSLRPDAVILDLQMPVMGGAEAMPLLREAAPDMVIVLYTASAVLDLDAADLPDAIVEKGGSPDAVLTTLRAALARRTAV